MNSTLLHPSQTSRLQYLTQYGQSVWLDYIRRGLFTSGELARLVQEDGVRGVTSNPAIFEKAIAGSAEYRDILEDARYRDADAKTVYEAIATRDIRDAADILRPVYNISGYRDGYVSLEVSPDLAHDTEGTLAEARRLWTAVGRPNLMIKIPATPEGIPAIRSLIARGVNVNVTLLFSRSVYRSVAEAFLEGLEQRLASGRDIGPIASVASFFISRVDTAVDTLLERIGASSVERRAIAAGLVGKTAIANAKLAWLEARQIFSSPRWRKLCAAGAQRQRLLWASTGSKDPRYRDVVYVEELIGPDTVNTTPPATLAAFRDHGVARHTLSSGLDEAVAVLESLAAEGISIEQVADELLADGIRQFRTAFSQLLEATGRGIGGR